MIDYKRDAYLAGFADGARFVANGVKVRTETFDGVADYAAGYGHGAQDARSRVAMRAEQVQRWRTVTPSHDRWVEALREMQASCPEDKHGAGVLEALLYNVEHHDEIRAAEAPVRGRPDCQLCHGAGGGIDEFGEGYDCPCTVPTRVVPTAQDCEHCGWWTRMHGASGLCEATSGSWDADETCCRWATPAFVATARAAQERIRSDADEVLT